MNRTVQWRKKPIQLLTVSILCFIFMSPRTIFQFCRFLAFQTNDILVLYYHSAFFANYIMFLFPFVCCAAMTELGKKNFLSKTTTNYCTCTFNDESCDTKTNRSNMINNSSSIISLSFCCILMLYTFQIK